jgi:hypothetical protein
MRAQALGFLLAVPGLLLLAACGNNDDTSTETNDVAVSEGSANEAPAAAAVEEAEAPAVAAADCPATSITGTTPAGTAFEATSAVAANIQDGAAYTLYLSDFDLTLDSFSMIRNPEVPADGIMWTVAVTIFNAAPEDIVPIEAGRVVEADRPFGELTFTVVVQEGDQFSGASAGQQGTVTVTGVGDVLCGTIEYSDDEKSITGTFQAPTKAI